MDDLSRGMDLIAEIKQVATQGAYEIGVRLRELKEHPEYVPPNKTLAQFVNDEGLDYKKDYIQKLITYTTVVDNLCIESIQLYPAEGIIRPLKQLKEPEAQREVWESVKADNPTFDKVKEAVDKYKIDIAQPKTKKGEPDKRVFNYTNENIDWAKWSWNPVTGCKHGCPYCYARDISIRFSGDFEPREHMYRLSAPRLTVIPDHLKEEPGITNVFVCSMADLFGEWVPEEWVKHVFNACLDNPQWTYIFLTKNPLRLARYEWQDNWWVGTTVDNQSRVDAAEEAFANVEAKVKFVSIEPFNERITFNHLDRFGWVIIGGRSRSSGMDAFQPESSWVEHLIFQARRARCAIYFKPNLSYGPKEFPR